eukprot:evm.model.scf_1028.7 EVM.evm.TU.scf_1028.7   scf_1028:42815-43105(+)
MPPGGRMSHCACRASSLHLKPPTAFPTVPAQRQPSWRVSWRGDRRWCHGDSSAPLGNDEATEEDRAYMRRALGLARRGLGATAPNPAVGCVVVKNGE